MFFVSQFFPQVEKNNFQKRKNHMKNGMIEYSNGDRIWYLNGKLHRDLGPAVEYSNGYRAWYLNGKRHRVDGPAIERSNGDRIWYLNDKRHRVDGPAVEYSNGDRIWYLNDNHYTFAEWLEHNPHLDSKKRIMYRLKYAEHTTHNQT